MFKKNGCISISLIYFLYLFFAPLLIDTHRASLVVVYCSDIVKSGPTDFLNYWYNVINFFRMEETTQESRARASSRPSFTLRFLQKMCGTLGLCFHGSEELQMDSLHQKSLYHIGIFDTSTSSRTSSTSQIAMWTIVWRRWTSKPNKELRWIWIDKVCKVLCIPLCKTECVVKFRRYQQCWKTTTLQD